MVKWVVWLSGKHWYTPFPPKLFSIMSYCWVYIYIYIPIISQEYHHDINTNEYFGKLHFPLKTHIWPGSLRCCGGKTKSKRQIRVAQQCNQWGFDGFWVLQNGQSLGWCWGKTHEKTQKSFLGKWRFGLQRKVSGRFFSTHGYFNL